MTGSPHTRIAVLAVLGLALGACATVPNAFERHDRVKVAKAMAEAAEDRVVCPVVVSNATDQHLEAGYALQGEESLLGVIPAGRSLSFQVRCAAERIEAFATAPDTGFLGDPERYRTVAALDRTQATQVSFTLTDRVH